MCVYDQRFQGVTEEPVRIRDCVVSHGDSACRGSWVLVLLCCAPCVAVITPALILCSP